MITVYLSLGTNLGDRLANLEMAVKALPPQVLLEELSSVYRTEPWGYADQPEFLNQVVRGKTALGPEELLVYLNSLEDALGREPSFRYGPRLIDIDLLFYEDLVIDTPSLSIPHPRLHERSFVLAPLAEIAPDLQHPLTGKTVRQMLEETGVQGVHRIEGEG